MNFKKLLLIPSFVLLALTNTSFVNANDGDIVVYTDDKEFVLDNIILRDMKYEEAISLIASIISL